MWGKPEEVKRLEELVNNLESKVKILNGDISKLELKNRNLLDEINQIKALSRVDSLALNYNINSLVAGALFLVPMQEDLRIFSEVPGGFAFIFMKASEKSYVFTSMGIVKTKEEALEYAKNTGYILVRY